MSSFWKLKAVFYICLTVYKGLSDTSMHPHKQFSEVGGSYEKWVGYQIKDHQVVKILN